MTPRNWIWTAVSVQVVGLAFDAVWHGLLHPGFEASTVSAMITHLSTVHVPIYIGVVAVLLTTAWTLVDRMRQSRAGMALPIAFAGAVVSAAGEGWHAYSHLQLSTHSGPIAEFTSIFGLIIVATAVWLDGRRALGRAAGHIDERRAA